MVRKYDYINIKNVTSDEKFFLYYHKHIFLDKKLTAAIIDRIIHHSHLITFTGESYRLKNSIINSD